MKQILITGMTVLFAGLGMASVTPHVRPLEEGYLVAGTEGRLAREAETDQWAFFPIDQIVDGKEGLLPAGQGILLLPCSVLDQMVQLAGDESTMSVRLWALVTECRGTNYLYGLHFLPMKAQAEATPSPPAEPTPVEPQAKESVLPREILQMIQHNRIPDLKRLDEIVVASADRNLIHRTGQLQAADDGFVFTPDAFGQNVGQGDYRLLPGKALEGIQRAMQRTSGRQRYVVSGVTTVFEGQTYLLVRRAVRTYTHGNFTP